jgi:hypothetical protein
LPELGLLVCDRDEAVVTHGALSLGGGGVGEDRLEGGVSDGDADHLRPLFRGALLTAKQLGDLLVGLLAEQPDDDGAEVLVARPPQPF